MIGAAAKGFVVPVALLALAEGAAFATNLQSDSLAPPSAILVAGLEALADGTLLAATRETLTAAFAGLALGGLIGLVLGTLLGTVPVLNRLMDFSIETVRPIPSIALLPIGLLVFGYGYRMEIAIIAFAATWPVLILTRAATARTEPRLMEVSRALGMTPLDRITKIVLPAALPRIFVALRLATGVALIVAVTVEVTGNPIGVGNAMMVASQSLRPGLALACLLWIGVIGWSLNRVMLAAQQRLFGRAALVGEPR